MASPELEELRRRFHFRCGHCGVSEQDAGARLTVAHSIVPRAAGGADEPDNWAHCCFACNRTKSDHWRPDSPQRILHPLRDRLEDHLAEQPEGVLVGLTDTGSFHIQQLQLNRPELVERRRSLSQQEAAGERLRRAQEKQERLRRRVHELEETLTQAEARLRSA